MLKLEAAKYFSLMITLPIWTFQVSKATFGILDKILHFIERENACTTKTTEMDLEKHKKLR